MRAFFRREGSEHAQPAPGLMPGLVIGDMRLVGLIGQGGMGQVWEAEQVSLRRRVAVKFVRPELATERLLELFAREARAGARLGHPGIVTVHGFGQSDGHAWISMEFVEGAWTLRDFLDDVIRDGELPEDYDRHVARLVAEIADAMQVAHDAGVIHRDLKPQNVLITRHDRPKVTDFGLARITDEASLSLTGELSGTCWYMSPEQVAARRAGIDQRTDVFSLGIVLYELLALRKPFEGDTTQQVVAAILEKDPPEIRTVRSRVPLDLVAIAGKALEKDRDRRYPSMGELAADLRRHLAFEPIHARPPTRLDRLVKWTRRHPVRSVAAGITVAAFVVVSALSLALFAKSRESRERQVAAEHAAELARQSEREALAARDEVLRLSAIQRLDDLTTEADRLWPAHPQNVERYGDWLERAAALVAELPDHERKLAELRARARPQATTDEPAVEANGARTFDDAEDRWWHSQLEKLTNGIRAFADDETGLFSAGTSPEHGWGIEQRLQRALELDEGFAPGGAYARAWADALPQIRETYPGLELEPQLGLLPLGPDPASGLWEFAHLETGAPAERRPDGSLSLEEPTGLVFVLLPAATFPMGSQPSDPTGRNYDPAAEAQEGPVHDVPLSAFFVSKYEMTQAQWERVTGRNPSGYTEGPRYAGRLTTRLHPVEQVSWTTCMELLGRLGLTLPSEAQWEYAARGGTTTPWWTGDERESLRGAANVADQSLSDAGAQGLASSAWPELDDGYAIHAPVDALSPNPFGLHGVCGNVWEWCLDSWNGAFYDEPSTLDPVRRSSGSPDRVMRGGGFLDPFTSARSAYRTRNSLSLLTDNLGLRPVRVVER